jgi:DNA invertase Pin-like site-specific DNA recombinase
VIRERTRAGLKVAEARGRRGGRKPVVTEEKLHRARQLMREKLSPASRLARRLMRFNASPERGSSPVHV